LGGSYVRRRDFIGIVVGSAAAWPLLARAQRQPVKTVGILLPGTAEDPVFQARLAAFYQELALLGWTIGRNVRIEPRWGTANAAELRRHAQELVALAPDVIPATGDSTVPPLQQATHTIPIVFPLAGDPVGAGFVDSLARPGSNATGFMLFEYTMGGKWLELRKEIAPNLTRVAVLRDPANPSQTAQFGAMRAVAPALRVEIIPVNVRDASEIERGVTDFACSGNGGLIPTSGALALRHRDLIITLAARHKLPAIYWERFFVTNGGLMSYGPDLIDNYRRAAGYVDRILKGEKPGDLPVQTPTKYETANSLKTAKALGLSVPLGMQQRADEMIE
jgi:putative tryptophan/tyrosine transport system substrate-binding protein